MNKILTLSVAVALATFAGCKKEEVTPDNCRAKAGTQYDTGVSRATAENKVDKDNGTKAGSELGYEDGKKAGLGVAYTTGYNSSNGYKKGYNETYPTGFTRGKNDTRASVAGSSDGRAKGQSDGRSDGDRVGSADGQTKGSREGKADGYYDGYEDGYNAAYSTYGNDYDACPGVASLGLPVAPSRSIASDKVKKKELPAACELSGYNVTRNAQKNYNEGYAEAQKANGPYNSGYDDFKNDPDTIAKATAIGLADGKVKGDEQGWKDGYASVYNPAYASAYKGAYDSVYGNAYNGAYTAKYIEWYKYYYDSYYDSGYDDGYDDGEGDYCATGYGSLETKGDALRVVQSSSAKSGRPNYRKSANFTKHSVIGYNQPKADIVSEKVNSERAYAGKRGWNRKAKDTGKWAKKNPTIRGGAWFLDLSDAKDDNGNTVVRQYTSPGARAKR